MEAQNFDNILRTLSQRTPFRPFTVSLLNGDRFEVDFPRALAVREGVAVYVAPGGALWLFDHQSVSQVIDDIGNRAKPPSSPSSPTN